MIQMLARLFSAKPDPREALRPLWRRVVELARAPEWYRDCGVADTIEGRFDMVTAVLSLVISAMERSRDLLPATGLLTEFFVEDMDGQLRQSGVGDLMVGKHMGKLMSTLGGRIGAFGAALSQPDDIALEQAARRNITMADASRAQALAARLRGLARQLEETGDEALLAGEFA